LPKLLLYRDGPIRSATPDLANGMTAPRHRRSLVPIVDRTVDALLPGVEGIEPAGRHPRPRAGSPTTTAASIVCAGRVRRLLTPELAVVQRLSRGEFPQVSEHNRVYYRDIYDHLVRIDLALENLREDAEVVLSTYLAQVNNRMSEVMKVLSVVAAIALPATVISGIFGTNFDNVPASTAMGFAVMMTAMVSLAGE
jgi:hypothetical protein